MSDSNEKVSIQQIDADIQSLKEMLAATGEEALKFEQRMKVYERLAKMYNLRLRYSGTGRGGAFK